MKRCNFEIEAFFVPFDYEDWYNSMTVELTDEQFDRYCDALRRWKTTDEWKNSNIEDGDDYFIHRDLPDIWENAKTHLLADNLLKGDNRQRRHVGGIIGKELVK